MGNFWVDAFLFDLTMIHFQLLAMAALIVFSLVLVVVTIYLHPEKADNLQPLQSDHILNVVSPIFWNYWIDFLKKRIQPTDAGTKLDTHWWTRKSLSNTLTIKYVAKYPALLLADDYMRRVINIHKRPCLTLLAERWGDDDGEDDSRVQRISTRLMQGAI